jgi:hypothetical protein
MSIMINIYKMRSWFVRRTSINQFAHCQIPPSAHALWSPSFFSSLFWLIQAGLIEGVQSGGLGVLKKVLEKLGFQSQWVQGSCHVCQLCATQYASMGCLHTPFPHRVVYDKVICFHHICSCKLLMVSLPSWNTMKVLAAWKGWKSARELPVYLIFFLLMIASYFSDLMWSRPRLLNQWSPPLRGARGSCLAQVNVPC